MQIIRGKLSSNIHHLMRLRTYWFTPQMKSRILKCFRPLFQITWTTSRNDICPISSSTLGPWHYMIKRQITFGTAVLTRELVSKKQVESGKCYFFLRPNIILQNDYRWYFYTYWWTIHVIIVLRHNIDSFHKCSFDCILPTPQRERVIRKWSVISVEN